MYTDYVYYVDIDPAVKISDLVSKPNPIGQDLWGLTPIECDRFIYPLNPSQLYSESVCQICFESICTGGLYIGLTY
jgi:hypothetical protein